MNRTRQASRRLTLHLCVMSLLIVGAASASADGRRHTFSDRNSRIQRDYRCAPAASYHAPASVRSYSNYPVYTRTSYSRVGGIGAYRSGSRLRSGVSLLGNYHSSYYRPDYSPYGNAYTRGRFTGFDYSGYRGHYGGGYARGGYQASPAVYIIYSSQNLVYVPVLYSFGVVDNDVQSPEEMAEAAQLNARRRERAWTSLEDGHTKRAIAEFTRLCADVPNDAAAHVGFAVSAAMDRNYHTAAWAMREAFRDSDVVPTELQLDPKLHAKLEALTKRYEARVHQYGGEYADGQFMLGAFSYLMGDHQQARAVTEDAIASGDRDPSTRNLNELAGETFLPEDTLLADARGF